MYDSIKCEKVVGWLNAKSKDDENGFNDRDNKNNFDRIECYNNKNNNENDRNKYYSDNRIE